MGTSLDSESNETEIYIKIKNGDQKVFKKFFDAHHAELFRYLRQQGSKRRDIYEATQTIPSAVYDEFEMEIENVDDKSSVSDQDFEIEMELNPELEISDNTGSTVVSINIDPSGWFVDSQGNPLDPSDPANKELIENNIENSFKAEADDDNDDDDNSDDD